MKTLFRLAIALALVVLAHVRAAGACPGDCGDEGTVTAADLRLGVEIALRRQDVGTCTTADRNGDGAVTVDELVAAALSRQDQCAAGTSTPRPTSSPTPTPTTAIEPVFPADYRATFVEVRKCRFSTEHGGVNIRVLANPIAVQDYLEERNPLPEGSIIVKEEFDGSDCNDANLSRWRAMRKEAPGFDPVDADWHWQWVNADRSVLSDDKSTCIGCHVRPACTVRDYMCTEDSGMLEEVLANQAGALLSVSGTGPSDVLAVGADPASDSLGPLVYHYDGTGWLRLNTRATGDLWWVSVAPIDGNFYMSGDSGLVLRYAPGTQTFTRMETGTNALLFGIWGASATDLWAVGGDDSGDRGMVLHYDGSQWTPQDLSSALPSGVPSLFKVFGRAADDVYAVGAQGTIIHFDGGAWQAVQSTSRRPLFTVFGDAERVFAVGGFIDGAILELEGDAFADVTPAGMPQMNGVFSRAGALPAAVGRDLSLARRTASGWALRQRTEGTLLDFHATWIDPEGGVWAVGGDLVALTDGLLQYEGPRTISSVIQQPARCPLGESGPGGTVSYANDVTPLLQQAHCLDLGCHGGAFPSSAYDQRSYASSFKQGIEAKALDVCPLVPGDPDASYLIEKLQAGPRLGARMPSTFPALSSEQIDLIRAWVLEGARNN